MLEEISLETEGSSRLPVGWKKSCSNCLRRVEIENLFHQELEELDHELSIWNCYRVV